MRTSSQTKFRSKLFSSKFYLRAGRRSNTAKVRLLWFWEARNINKGGELISVDMLLIHENFFSIKLATINSSLESNPDAALSIENMPRFSDTQFPSSDGFVQAKTHGSLKIDLQSNVQMGFGDVQQQSSNNSCSEATLQMKPQPCEEGVLFCFNNMP
ncbi:hypothetical protein Bca4012_051121 [Brassica carinata]